MTRRTVLAGKLGPQEHPLVSRDVYVCVPEGLGERHRSGLEALLDGILRSRDRLLYAHTSSATARRLLGAHAAQRLMTAGPITSAGEAPDLIVIVIDPLGDNTAAINARALAMAGDSDLLIAELPDPTLSPTDFSPHSAPSRTDKEIRA